MIKRLVFVGFALVIASVSATAMPCRDPKGVFTDELTLVESAGNVQFFRSRRVGSTTAVTSVSAPTVVPDGESLTLCLRYQYGGNIGASLLTVSIHYLSGRAKYKDNDDLRIYVDGTKLEIESLCYRHERPAEGYSYEASSGEISFELLRTIVAGKDVTFTLGDTKIPADAQMIGAIKDFERAIAKFIQP